MKKLNKISQKTVEYIFTRELASLGRGWLMSDFVV